MLRISLDLDVVSADTRTGVVSSLVASPHEEDMPAWAEDAPLLIYVTDRDGTPEIWAREPARADRMVVGPVQMGEEGSYQLPVPSPHGRRIAFTLLPVASGSQPTAGRLWIAATAGGSPLPATTPSGDYQVAACWSPDGANLAYLSGAGALFRLMVVPSSGGAAPRVVVPRVGLGVNVDLWSPAWSPDGKLLAYEATDGFVHLVAPDGANDHLLTRTPLAVWTFSADSQSLYGIVTHGSTADLVSVALASGAVHTIGSLGNHLPGAEVQPGYRLSLAPDGRSLAYGTGNDAHELDLVEPYPPATGAMARLREWLHLP